LLFNAIDFVYFRFINTRTTAEIFKYVTLSNDVLFLIPQFLKDFWFVPFIWGLIAWAFWDLFSFLFSGDNFIYHTHYTLKKYIIRFLIIILWSSVSFISIRGGFQLRPLNIASASQYAPAKYIPLVLNTPFNIIKTINKETIILNNYFVDEKELNKFFNPVKIQNNSNLNFNNSNVIVFILEGFSKEYFGSLNKNLDNGTYKGYTPFLDSIIQNSMTFENAFANGKRTIDAPPAILGSIPNLMNNAYVISPYSSNKINSLASLLKIKGYTSYFFHGGTNGTMGFDNFSKLAGFDFYFGRKEYNNDADFDGKWGIYDEPFLQQMALELNKSQKPFLATVFTLSSHHPYKIPEKYKNKFPKGNMNIHESIGYVDFALKKFFETASQMNWFNNTLFVFTADHTSEAYHDIYKTKKGLYEVPIFFYKPNSTLLHFSKRTAQHTDILPTILDILNYDKSYISFGNSLLDSLNKGFSANYCDEIYQIITDKYLLTFNGSKCLELYNLENDLYLQNNIINSSDIKLISEIENVLKAYIQSYQYRMINNKLTTE